MAATSKAQVTAKIRCFLREAYRRRWTEFALAEKVRPYRATREQKNLRVVNRKIVASWTAGEHPRLGSVFFSANCASSHACNSSISGAPC